MVVKQVKSADLSRKSCLGGPAAIEKEEAEWQHASAWRMVGEESTRLPFSKSCAGKCMCPHRLPVPAALFGPKSRPVLTCGTTLAGVPSPYTVTCSSKVPIHDTLILDEMIDWYTFRHLQGVSRCVSCQVQLESAPTLPLACALC